MYVFICVDARKYIEASLEARTDYENRKKAGTLVKTANKDEPSVFGEYALYGLDVMHFQHIALYKKDQVWARYFVNYFRIYLEYEFGCRFQPMVTLDFISRVGFQRQMSHGSRYT